MGSNSPPTENESTEGLCEGGTTTIKFIIPLVISYTIATSTAMGGNLLIILSYSRDEMLRTVGNLYLINLAVIDFVIGAFFMPFYLYSAVWCWYWPFGRVACTIYSMVEHTLCEMTLLLVVLVDLDRLARVQKGAKYTVLQTRWKAYTKLAVCWVLSFLFFALPTVIWDIIWRENLGREDKCEVDLKDDFTNVLLSEMMAVSIPLISLLIIHTKLLMARKKSHNEDCGVKPHTDSSTTTRSGTSLLSTSSPRQQTTSLEKRQGNPPQEQEVTTSQKEARTDISVGANTITSALGSEKDPFITSHNQLSTTSRCKQLAHSPDQRSLTNDEMTIKRARVSFDKVSGTTLPRNTLLRITSVDSLARKMRRSKKSRQAMTLSLRLIIAIIICWLPHSVTAIIKSKCDACVGKILYETLYWLVWVKSSINPFLYGFTVPRFQRNIKDLLSYVLPLKFTRKLWRRRSVQPAT